MSLKKLILWPLAAVVFALLWGCSPNGGESKGREGNKSEEGNTASVEREIDFNFDWQFWLNQEKHYDTVDFGSSQWRDVRLPHDWSVEHDFDPNLQGATAYLPGGIAWYKKQFVTHIDADKQLAYLYFDGIYNHSEIWLNGTHIGGEVNGYTPFSIDISSYLKPLGEENLLAVKVDRSRYVDSRWYTGSGIYRNVKLVTANRLHIPIDGVYVTTPLINSEEGKVQVEIEIRNSLPGNQQFDLHSRVFQSDGTQIGTTVTKSIDIDPAKTSVFTQTLTVPSPKLWDLETPELYTVVSEIVQADKVVDSSPTRFGFRTLEYNPAKGFFLNGKHTLIKGVNIHHDGGLVGAAVPEDVWRRRLETLKEAGTNAIRMAHNPASRELMSLCDEMGLLVQAEIFDEWDNPKDKRLNKGETHDDYISRGYADYFQTHAEADLKAAVRRDRNHPSVIMWSIGNEIEWTFPRYEKATGYFDMNAKGNYFFEPPYITPEEIKNRFHTSEEGKYVLAKTAQKLSRWVKELDTTRPVTANLILPSVSHISGYTDALDIIGYSYRRVIYDYGRKLFPEKMIMGTENVVQWHEWKAVIEREFIAGTFLWTGIDYLGESHGKWPQKALYSGMIDLAGFEKPSFHMMKTLWSDEPHLKMYTQEVSKSPYKVADTGAVVEKKPGAWQRYVWRWYDVNPHWNYKSGETIVVELYSNCEQVELFLDDQSLGAQALSDQEDRIFKWAVPYRDGKIRAQGLNGCAASDEIATAAEPFALKVNVDKTSLVSGGYDVAHIELQLVDQKGNPVSHMEKKLTIDVPSQVELLGVDNGAVTSVQPFQSNKIETHEGRALVIVRAQKSLQDRLVDGGEILAEIKVRGKDLQEATISLSLVNSL